MHDHYEAGLGGQRFFFGCLLSALLVSVCCSQTDTGTPLYEQEPYDEITLTPKYKSQSFRIYPLDPAAVAKREQDLRVRLLDLPDRYYEISWRDIAEYRRFPEIILKEAKRFIEEKEFDRAFYCLDYLRRETPDLPGLDDAIGDLLFQDAANAYRQGEYAEALSLLDEVRRVTPGKSGLLAAAENVADKMFDASVDEGDFLSARSMLAWASTRFGGKMDAAVAAWKTRLSALAEEQLEAARQQAAAGDYQAAYDSSRAATRTWPELPGLSEFVAEISRRYPVVKVGVTRPARDMDPRRAEDWAARRTGRLRYRTLVEIQGYGPDGGEYLCPVGKVEVAPDSRTITITLHSGSRDSIAELFTGYDLANILLDMARPGGANVVPLWSQLVESIGVEDVYTVKVRLSQPLLNPISLLQTPLGQLSADDTTGPTNPYYISDRNLQQLRLVLNKNYVGRRPNQPLEIIEVYFDDPAAAVEALLADEIDVVDRLFPGDITNLKRKEGIIVRPYAVPSIHFLVPNFRKPLMQQRAFRRALVYGISRQTILEQDLLGNQRVNGCRLISGPFPPGVGTDDPLGYAYDERIRPRGYEPTLAITLAEVARSQLRGIATKAGAEPPVERPLVLAYSAAAVPRLASAAIAQYLSAIGIACEPRELRAGQTIPADDDWDLLYVDMVVTEPMFDIRQLLGAEGMIAGGSSYLELALRRLGLVANWEQARETLQSIHRLAHEEVAVVPLWQLTEFFAYRDRLRNVAASPLSLYQGVENWEIKATTESGKP